MVETVNPLPVAQWEQLPERYAQPEINRPLPVGFVPLGRVDKHTALCSNPGHPTHIHVVGPSDGALVNVHYYEFSLDPSDEKLALLALPMISVI
jgi:hypothetical protein